MAVEVSSAEAQAIRKLYPLTTLPISFFEELCSEISIQTADKNSVLFKRGDVITDLFYLLSGEISLQAEGLEVEIIKATQEPARFALAHQIPRKIDAVARTPVRYLRLLPETLNYVASLAEEEESSYMVIVEPEENSDDWMTSLLKSPIFRNLPPANLQRILMGLEEVVFEKGEQILRQGEEGDYYYLIKTGQCMLSRKPSQHAREIKLALLRTGDTFGEDSLLSERPRNVTITALTQLSLLRLSKEKFLTLIKEPSLLYLNYEQLQQAANAGAVILDVRSTEEYNKLHLDESISAPFFTLRMQLKTMNRNKPVIVVCTDGKTSEAAAFILLKNKFQASILQGGMESVSEILQAPVSFPPDDTSSLDQDISGQNSVFISPNDNYSELTSDIGSLKQRNEELIQENQMLRKKCEQLFFEKEEAEKQFRILSKQTEKLKAVLDTLKKV